MGEPRVSVILPVHDAERWLERCVRSVLDQTMGDLELIAVDDASSDGSWSLLHEMAVKDDRLVIERLRVNRGPGGARNVALDRARGEWLAFIDADDAWLPTRLERMLCEGMRFGVDVVVDEVQWMVEIDGTLAPFRIGNHMGRWWLRKSTEVVDASAWIRRGLVLKPVIRRVPISDLRQDDTLWFCQDYVHFVRALDRLGRTLLVVREPLYLYTIRPDSVRSTPGNDDELQTALEVLAVAADLTAASRADAVARLRLHQVERTVTDWHRELLQRSDVAARLADLGHWKLAHWRRLGYLTYRSIWFRSFVLFVRRRQR